MTTTPHKIPELRRAGFRQTVPTPGGKPSGRGEPSRGGWASSAPTVHVAHAGFYRIQFDGATDFEGDVDLPETCWWYPLRIIKPDVFGDDVALVSATLDMLPTCYNDLGNTDSSGDSLAWGDVRGMSAAIVIGKNLGLTPGKWRARPSDIVGIFPFINAVVGNFGPNRSTMTAGATDADSAPSPLLAYTNFPPGSFLDTLCVPKRAYFPFAGTAARIKQGETLEVALVLGLGTGNQFGPSVTGSIFGYAHASLVLAVNTPESKFSA